MSRQPKRSSARAAALATEASSVTSMGQEQTSYPFAASEASAAKSLSSPRAVIMTDAPSDSSCSAIASPSPLEPPVISTLYPLRSLYISPPAGDYPFFSIGSHMQYPQMMLSGTQCGQT